MFVVGNINNIPEMAIELVAFQECYALLCNTIKEIEDLLQYFKTENVITSDEVAEIKSISTVTEKTKRVMINVSTSLEAGNTNNFYAMLKVMKNHGLMSTQNLSELITSRLKVSNTTSPSNTSCQTLETQLTAGLF